MKRVTVVRCPRCGSTDAGSREAMSMADITSMHCSTCGYGEPCDQWQIKFDWNVDIDLPDDATELPKRVAPLDPQNPLDPLKKE